jgi:hypothetical protein
MLISDPVSDAQLILGPDRYVGAPGAVFLAFRGSTTRCDWKINARVWLIPSALGGGARVHAGFSEQWSSVRERVLSELQKTNPTQILLTGHSLGSALATISATDVMARFPDAQVELITFGAPRCGNAEFIDKVSARVDVFTRVVNDSDFIPWMPAALMSYAHCSVREWLHIRSDGTTEWREAAPDSCWAGLLSLWNRTFKLELGVTDHFVERYLETLASAISPPTDVLQEGLPRGLGGPCLGRAPVGLARVPVAGRDESSKVALDLARTRGPDAVPVSGDARAFGTVSDSDGDVHEGDHESCAVDIPQAEAQADE